VFNTLKRWAVNIGGVVLVLVGATILQRLGIPLTYVVVALTLCVAGVLCWFTVSMERRRRRQPESERPDSSRIWWSLAAVLLVFGYVVWLALVRH